MSDMFTNNGEGRVFVAPADTVVGQNLTDILAAVTGSSSAFTDIGSLDDNGLEITPRSVDSETKDWNGVTAAQEVSTIWKFGALDFMKVEAIKAAFGEDNTSVDSTDSSNVLDYDGEIAGEVVLVAIMKDGDKCVAEVLRNGKCTNTNSVKYAKKESSINSLEFKGVQPSDGGKSFYRVWK